MLSPLTLYATFVALLGAQAVLANNPFLDSDMSDRYAFAKAAAPYWQFVPLERCFPTGALDGNGQPHSPGLKHCAPKENGGNGKTHDFPTYFRIGKCNFTDGEQRRVLYDVYFPYSTNLIGAHDHDWEWAVVIWKRWSQNTNYWVRDAIILEAHGKTKYHRWNQYKYTVTHDDREQFRKDADNPVIEFSIDGHGLNDASTVRGRRPYYWGADWLSDAAAFPRFDWGSANSSPDTFGAGGWHELCVKV